MYHNVIGVERKLASQMASLQIINVSLTLSLSIRNVELSWEPMPR